MTLIAAVDVHYRDASATAACVLFAGWQARKASNEYVLTVESAQPYVPGRFYLRELPPTLAVIKALDERPDIVIVDGYVWLGSDRPGLGYRVYEALERGSAVVGVAKSAFVGNDLALPVYRGTSSQPLYVTTVGLEQDEAATVARNLQAMHGAHRIPNLLKQADRLSRKPKTS